ncbi:MAG: hypothetical protein WC587_00975 [Candidatus Paceibacterota bacterium]
MLVFVLILILIAILYSTERGRELLKDVLLLPFKIIGIPFKLIREGKDRIQEEKLAQEIPKDKEEIKILLSKKQIEMLDEISLEIGWKNNKDIIIEQVKFFESILESGADPRNLNLTENFYYIKSGLFEKAKKELLDKSKNFIPKI